MEVVNPSMMVSRLSGVSGLCGGWMNISSTPLGFWEYLGIYRAKRRSGGLPRWAQPTRARLGLLGMPPSAIPSFFQQLSLFYSRLYFYSSHDMCALLGVSCMICVFACFILCLKLSILAGHTYLREPKFMS